MVRVGRTLMSLSLLMALVVASPGSAGATGAPPLQAGAKRANSKVPYIVQDFSNKVAKKVARGNSAATLSNDVLHATRSGDIELAIHSALPVLGAQITDLEDLGATIVTNVSSPATVNMPAVGLVQASVPHNKIDDLDELSWVTAITPPGYGVADTHPTNTTLSQGVAFHNADDVQTRGINGTGVNVGVISDGVQNLATAQAGNDLPAVTVLNAGTNDEGTAMLEIVHDMAPGAGLIFDTQGGVAGHAAALNNLVANNANVITEDLAFDTEPAFQRGLLAQTGDNIAGAGVPVHSSAGNQAQRHSARVVATGTGGAPDGTSNTFTGCANTPDNVVAIAPTNDTTFDVMLGQNNGNGSSFVLQWSEPRSIFPTAGQGGFTDLNLYVMDAALTQCLGQSTTVQANGTGDTIEIVTMPAGSAGTAAKLVVDVQGTSSAVAAPTLDLRWRRAAATDTTTRAGALNPDSNYIGLATSSAALDAQNAGALEGFSSGGPVQLITTTQCPGGAAGPCTGVAGTSQTSPGPTWAAADNVSVSGAGTFPTTFSGTSAAAPHAAGCDALLRDALNNAAIATATTNGRLAVTAIDVAPNGVDNITGAGQLDCLAAVNTPPEADAGGPYNTVEGTDVTLDGSGSSDVDTGDSIIYAWDLDNDGAFDDATGVSPSFGLVGQDGIFPVALRVTDTAGAIDVDTANVTVTNVAPTVGAITTDAPKNENTALAISGEITDPGWLDPLTATISFGDGAPAIPLLGTIDNTDPDASLTYNLTHIYGDDGTFTITVCAADDDTTNNCNSTTARVDNVNPTALINTTGTTSINGIPTFVNHVGQQLAFSARSTDDGSDDLNLTWDWDDGPPSPDVSTVYLVNPPALDADPSPSIQPRDVTDPQNHTFGGACLYTITFASLDDDSGSASSTAQVIITGNATKNRSAGYWYNQFRDRNKSNFTPETLNCYLEIVGFMSQVFNEKKDVSTIAKAESVLKTPTTKTTVVQSFDRQLLAAWLNFANGSVDLGTLVDTNGDGTLDTTLVNAIYAAEAVRLNPTSTNAQLIEQKNILERINLRDGG